MSIMRAVMVIGLSLALTVFAHGADQAKWENPIKNKRYLKSPLVEVSPFVLNDRLYLLENWQAFWDVPGSKPVHAAADVVRIRDVDADRIVATPLKGHGFGTTLVWEGRVYVFASEWPEDGTTTQAKRVSMVSSADLKEWTAPVTVLSAKQDERIYNTAVCRGPDGFALLYETDDPKWPPFTFKYCKSNGLNEWVHQKPEAVYGTDKYVGGPALYHEGDFYYTLYLHDLGGSRWGTRVTRSRDLIHWHDAPADRPFVTFNAERKGLPLRPPQMREVNASDVELCYFKGKTVIYFTGSDQQYAGDLQQAEFDGTIRELLESFFDGVADTSPSPTR